MPLFIETIVIIVMAAALGAVVYEYRLRKPDELILFEAKDGLRFRPGPFYPRHFSLPLTRTTHSFTLTVDASAKGNIDVRVKLAVSVAAALQDVGTLIRVGGWNAGAVAKAAKELEAILIAAVKEHTEQFGIEELSSERIGAHLNAKIGSQKSVLGLEILSLSILSSEPTNPKISDALRQREHARIMEQTETLNQQTRIAAAKMKFKADEEIALMENELELKKFDLRRIQLEKESDLANIRVREELKRNRMKLDLDKEELELLKSNPELLLLTPQAARLAEASQGLKNAQTVVSLGSNELAQGADLLGLFQRMLQGTIESYRKKKEPKS